MAKKRISLEGCTAVLLSGGLHSSYAAYQAMRDTPGHVVGVFCAYGQRDGGEQEDSVHYVAQKLAMRVLTYEIAPFETGWPHEPMRNSSCLQACQEGGARDVVMGVAGSFPWSDPYGDSNPVWMKETAGLLGLRVRLPGVLVPSFVMRYTLSRAGIWASRLHR